MFVLAMMAVRRNASTTWLNSACVLGIGLGLAAGCVGLAANASAQAQLWDLGPGVFPQDASGDGSVVVGNTHNASGREAFRWTSAGGMVGLGDLPGGANEGTREYVRPTILSHSGEEILEDLGPAQACYPFGGGLN